jgi:hypothetical protein
MCYFLNSFWNLRKVLRFRRVQRMPLLFLLRGSFHLNPTYSECGCLRASALREELRECLRVCICYVVRFILGNYKLIHNPYVICHSRLTELCDDKDSLSNISCICCFNCLHLSKPYDSKSLSSLTYVTGPPGPILLVYLLTIILESLFS